MTKHTPAMQRLIAASVKKDAHNVLEQASLMHREFFDFYGPAPGAAGGSNPTLLEMADLTSATSGILNKVFGGRAVWSQLNEHSQLYRSLPKTRIGPGLPYGWRAKSAFASTGRGGNTEGAIPTAVTSTYKEIAPTIVEHATQMRISGLMQDLAAGPDDAYGMLADVAAELAIEHAKEFERGLTLDVDTASGTSIDSVDRATSSSANQAAIGWTAGDEDFAGVDRSANTWYDPVQSAAATAVTLSLKTLDQQIRDVHKNGGYTTFIATGWDTWAAISDILEPRLRFDGGRTLPRGGKVGEADAVDGMAYSAFIGQYQGRDIVASDQVQADASEISRIYGLDVSNPEGFDKPRMGIDVLRPTQMFLAGEKSGTTPQGIAFLGDSALAVTRHQLGLRFAKAEFGYRDFTAP